MANVFSPFGFSVKGRQDGAAWTGNQKVYNIAYNNAHAMYQGDPVTLLSTGYIDTLAPGSGGAGFTTAAMPIGIFAGCTYYSQLGAKTVYLPYWPAASGDTLSTTIVTAYLIDDPSVEFDVQTGYSGSGSGAATQAMVGMNAIYAYGTGSTLNGQSGAYLDLTTAPATTATFPFRIVGLWNDPLGGFSSPGGNPGANGSDTSSQYNWVRVMWNNEFYKQLVGI